MYYDDIEIDMDEKIYQEKDDYFDDDPFENFGEIYDDNMEEDEEEDLDG